MNHYIIRKKLFDYDNEYYDVKQFQLGEISGVYDDLTAAEQALQQLTIAAVRDQDLYIYNVPAYTPAEVIEAVHQRILDHSGIALYQDGCLSDVVPDALSDEDTLHLAEQFGISPYQLECLNDENYVIWDAKNQAYLRLPDPYGNPNEEDDFCGELIWGTSANFPETHPRAEAFIQHLLQQIFPSYARRRGSIEELSASPAEFEQQLAQSQAAWAYQEHKLSPKSYVSVRDFAALKAVNDLLKQPFFEIHQIDFHALKALIELEETREVR